MLLWADSALDDLHGIRGGLSPQAAARIGRIIAESADVLVDFPERGRPGIAPGTRELPLPGLPWRLIYAVSEDGGRISVLRLV